MQTYPCGHRVVCRRCFVKTIQIAVSQRMLPLRCVICRTKILRLKQTTSSMYFRGALGPISSASPNSPISPTYIFNQHQQLASLAGFRASSMHSDKSLSPLYDPYVDADKDYISGSEGVGCKTKNRSSQARPTHLELHDQHGYALLQQKIKVCDEPSEAHNRGISDRKIRPRPSSPHVNKTFYGDERVYNPEHGELTLYATRQRKNYINYRRKYKSVASKAANLPPIAELESPSHTYRSAASEDGDEIISYENDDEEDLMSTSASTPLMSNYKKSFLPSFLRPKSAKKFFRSQK